MANINYKYFILTGDPGVGKTTLVKKISEILNGNGIKTSGFYTEEVRRNCVREGFDVVTLDGKRGRLARDMYLLDSPVKYKVGKYGVLIEDFENIALPTLTNVKDTTSVLVIDEIGKMEFFSATFKTKIKELLNSTCNIIATIPVRKGDPVIESIRNNVYSKVWTITRENRNRIHEDIVHNVLVALDTKHVAVR